MQTLSSIGNDLGIGFSKFDEFLAKAEIYTESSFDEYGINLREANLKVVQEEGTTEDLVYLEEAAKDGLINRAVSVAKELFEKFKKWIQTIVEKITSFFKSETTKASLDKIKEASDKYPDAKKIKVEIADPKSVDKEYGSISDKCRKIFSKYRQGRLNQSDKNELEKIEKDLEDNGSAIKSRVKKITVGVTTAIAMITGALSALNRGKPTSDDMKSTDKKSYEVADPDDMQYAHRAVTHYWKTWRFWASNYWELIQEGLSDIRKKMSDVISKIRTVKEASENDTIKNIYNRLFAEGKDDEKQEGEEPPAEDTETPEDEPAEDEEPKASDNSGDDEEPPADDTETPENEPAEDEEPKASDDDDKKEKKSKKKDNDNKEDESDEDKKDNKKSKKDDDNAGEDGEEPVEESAYDEPSFFDDDNLDPMAQSFFGEDSASDLIDGMGSFFDENE